MRKSVGLGLCQLALVLLPALRADTITVTPSVSLNGTEGTTLSSVLLGIFTSSNNSLTPGDFTALVNWGDGTSVSAALIALDPVFGFDINGTHTYAQAGTYSLALSVSSDDGGLDDGSTGIFTIADAALTGFGLNFTTLVGIPYSGSVGTFQDANASATPTDFSATINWGDFTTSAGTVLSLGAGSFGINGSHTYSMWGTYTATVNVQDFGGSTATFNDSVLVTPEAPGWMPAGAGLLMIALRRRLSARRA